MKITTTMTKEEYINFTINCLKTNAKHFVKAHYPELGEYYAEQIGRNQYELVKLGFSWEAVIEIETEAYKTVQ